MKNADYRANNLLLRVASYTPREGREAMEDFCTKVLAWCLLNSEQFQNAFLELLSELKVGSCTGEIVVHTQESFTKELDRDEDEETVEAGEKSRFDLVIECCGHQRWIVVIESKVGPGIGLQQVGKYRQARQQDKFKVKYGESRFLVSLTNSSKRPEGVDAHIPWCRVQDILDQLGEGAGSSECTLDNRSLVPAICRQFADYLAEKGLSPMKIEKYSPEEMKLWLKGLTFQSHAETILLSARETPGLSEVLQKKVILDCDPDGTKWLGIYYKLGSPFFTSASSWPAQAVPLNSRYLFKVQLQGASTTLNRDCQSG